VLVSKGSVITPTLTFASPPGARLHMANRTHSTLIVSTYSGISRKDLITPELDTRFML
jgi:hypothetical protein